MPGFFEVQRLMDQVAAGRMSRRDFMRRATALGFTAAAAAGFLASAPASAASATATTSESSSAGGKKGGTLKVALNTDLASADIMFGTPDINRDVMGNVYEYLYTLSSKNTYLPMLAEKDMDVSPDGKIFTIPLRKGVKFQNGSPFTSADAVASLQRWQRMTPNGTSIMAHLVSLEALDDYTVKITFNQPNGGLQFGLGNYAGLAAMLSKPIIDKYYDATKKADGEIQPADAIGTGPYKLQQWVRDNSITLVRYDGYASRPEPSDGRGGMKHAYFDKIVMYPVSDPNTRLNGLLANEYNFNYAAASSQYDQIKSDPSLITLVIKQGSRPVAVFNKKQGPFTSEKLRQAALYATDVKEVMAGTIDNQALYLLTPSLAGPAWTTWYTTAGGAPYTDHDPAKAKQLLQESGYKGEKLRWITTKDFDYMYNSALIASKEWQAVGFNIDLVVSDWPTVVANRSKPDAYEIFSTGIGFEGDPIGTSAYTPNWPGWTTSPGVTGADASLVTTTDPAQRKKLWEQLQTAFYIEVPYIQFGEMFGLRAATSNVANTNTRNDLMLWNMWFK